MFQPLEGFIGLRYLRSRRRRGVVSFMSAASLLGIALGVAALITILSVMNGLETETRTRLLSMTAHASIVAPQGFADWADLQRRLSAVPGVVDVAPFVSIEGMLAAGTNLKPVVVRGILPDEERGSDLSRFVDESTLAELTPGGRRIILGRTLALNLGLKPGDPVTLLVPKIANGHVTPRYAAFTVAGAFEAGIQDHDSGLALVHMSDASDLYGLNGAAGGLAVQLADPLAVQQFHASLGAMLDPAWRYSDWTEEHRSLFTAIHIEKLMMSIILMLIVGVAAFNIVASLMMVVIDKQKDIAILRTYGLEPQRVARVFLVQGGVIGVVGTLVGTCSASSARSTWTRSCRGSSTRSTFKIMPGDVYYVTQLPSEVHLFDVIAIPAVALVVALLATLYPARRAAAVAPGSALRYD